LTALLVIVKFRWKFQVW